MVFCCRVVGVVGGLVIDFGGLSRIVRGLVLGACPVEEDRKTCLPKEDS